MLTGASHSSILDRALGSSLASNRFEGIDKVHCRISAESLSSGWDQSPIDNNTELPHVRMALERKRDLERRCSPEADTLSSH